MRECVCAVCVVMDALLVPKILIKPKRKYKGTENENPKMFVTVTLR